MMWDHWIGSFVGFFYLLICACMLFSSAEGNKSLNEKWGRLGMKLKKLRQQLVKSQTFAFTFDKVCS